MYWIVRRDNPKPEVYIPIFAYKSSDSDRFKDSKTFKVFEVKSEAVGYANKLQERFAATSIRLFYEEGHSEKLR